MTDYKNMAAWAVAPLQPLVVREAPYTPPKAHQIVVRTRAIGMNPVDYYKIAKPQFVQPWAKLPFVLGLDIAGEVVELGESARSAGRLKEGDRVFAFASSSEETRNDSAMGAYQHYVVVDEWMAGKLPEAMSFEEGAAVPAAAGTAGSALFGQDQLGLELPSTPRASVRKDEVVLVWGGSTSVGVAAIQQAVAAGYEVYTTCGPKNKALVESLGASRSWDYRSPSTTKEIVAALNSNGKRLAGALSIGGGSAEACHAVLVGATRTSKKLAMATYPTPGGEAIERASTAYFMWTFVSFSVVNWIRTRLSGVKASWVAGGKLIDTELGPYIFKEYLPAVLGTEQYRVTPVEVVGEGLESLQGALDKLKKGVSAKKLVVKIQ